MAKFKKKKSAPTGDTPKETTPPPETEPKDELPEVQDAPESGPKPEKPLEILSDENKSKLNKLFWMRVGLALLAGTVATFIFEDIHGEERRWASIIFMIVVFGATIFVAKGMKMQLPSSDRKKIVTQGIGSYVFLYLFIWIVSYTLVNLPSEGPGLMPGLP